MSDDLIRTRVEFALYLLAVRHPDEFVEVERFVPSMLANDAHAARRAKLILDDANG